MECFTKGIESISDCKSLMDQTISKCKTMVNQSLSEYKSMMDQLTQQINDLKQENALLKAPKCLLFLNSESVSLTNSPVTIDSSTKRVVWNYVRNSTGDCFKQNDAQYQIIIKKTTRYRIDLTLLMNSGNLSPFLIVNQHYKAYSFAGLNLYWRFHRK